MIKKILIIILFLIPIAYAIDAGDIFSQEQINNFNTELIDHNFLKCEDLDYIIYRENPLNLSLSILSQHYKCLNIRGYNISNYIIYWDYQQISIERQIAVKCLLNYPPQVCGQLYTSFCQWQVLWYVDSIKNTFTSSKTDELEEPYYTWAIDTKVVPD